MSRSAIQQNSRPTPLLLFLCLFLCFFVFLPLPSHGAPEATGGRAADALFEAAYQRSLTQARAQALGLSEAWRALGHYRKNFWGKWKSDVDSSIFFLDPGGRKSPEAELEATLRAFFSGGDFNREHQHPRCRFPARAQFLAEKLAIGEKDWPAVDCGRFEDFRQRLGAQSASLVFSSYYLNNPTSTLGHLLLRLGRSGGTPEEERAELLDYGINYAAVVDTQNPILYAFKGFLGYFDGTFTSMPYYYKVREYNDFEARDIWEYNLQLSAKEVALTVAHVWELGPASIDYYYFDENCATHILTLVAAARPSIQPDERLPSLIVMPTDAIRLVAETPGLVREVKYRPSIRSLLQKRVNALGGDELRAFRLLASGSELEAPLKEHKVEARARILDAAIDEIDDRSAKELLSNESGPAARRRQTLLVARAATGQRAKALEFPGIEPSRAPHRGHRPRRLGLYGGGGSAGPYTGISLRMGFHDRLDNPTGRFDSADVEFLSAHVRREWSEHRWAMDEIKVLELLSLSDLASIRPSPSWGFRFGGRRFREENCPSCFGAMAEGGIGMAWNVASTESYDSPSAWLFALAESDLSLVAGRPSGRAFRIDLGPRAGLLFRPLTPLALEASGGWAFPAWRARPYVQGSFKARWHEQNGWSGS